MHNWNTHTSFYSQHTQTHTYSLYVLTCESLLPQLISFSYSDPSHHSDILADTSAVLLFVSFSVKAHGFPSFCFLLTVLFVLVFLHYFFFVFCYIPFSHSHMITKKSSYYSQMFSQKKKIPGSKSRETGKCYWFFKLNRESVCVCVSFLHFFVNCVFASIISISYHLPFRANAIWHYSSVRYSLFNFLKRKPKVQTRVLFILPCLIILFLDWVYLFQFLCSNSMLFPF